MDIHLTGHSEELLKEQLAHGSYRTPEEVIERALENLVATSVPAPGKRTRAEAVAHIRESRKGVQLGGIKIKDLIVEGRKY